MTIPYDLQTWETTHDWATVMLGIATIIATILVDWLFLLVL